MQKHGSLPYAELHELGYDPHEILDFSANINPFPLPFELDALELSHLLRHYPDDEHRVILQSLASHYQIEPESFVIGAGSTELIYNLARLYPKGAVLAPSYGDYQKAHINAGGSLLAIPWTQDLAQIIHACRLNTVEILWICNPNNPTGEHLGHGQILELIQSLHDKIIVIDEAYQELGIDVESVHSLCATNKNLIVLKSWTKPYALAGLRCGFALSHPSLAPKLQSQNLPWGLPIWSQAIIPRLYTYQNEFEQQWEQIRSERQSLIQQIQDLGFSVAHQSSPFFLIHTQDTEKVRQWALREHKIALRNCASFGLPHHTRIMPQTPEHNAQLLRMLAQIRP